MSTLTESPNEHPLLVDESRFQAERVDAQPRQCYRNALMALLTDDALTDVGVCYVEGVIVYLDMGLPCAHGWLQFPDGRVVDPTAVVVWPLHDSPLAEPQVRYYPANTYSPAEARRLVGKSLPHFTSSRERGRAVHLAEYRALRAVMAPDASSEALAQLRRWYGVTDEAEED